MSNIILQGTEPLMPQRIMVQEVKLKLYYDGLKSLVNALKDFQLVAKGDEAKMVESIRRELLTRFYKKMVEHKLAYTFKLSTHEAVALKLIIWAAMDIVECTYELNNLQLIAHFLDQKLA